MKHTVLIACCLFLLASLCVGSGFAMVLTDDYRGAWARFLALALPIGNLFSVYAMAVLYILYFFQKGPQLRFIDYIMILGILVLWTLIMYPMIGNYSKLETRRVPPGEIEFLDSRDQPESRDSP